MRHVTTCEVSRPRALTDRIHLVPLTRTVSTLFRPKWAKRRFSGGTPLKHVGTWHVRDRGQLSGARYVMTHSRGIHNAGDDLSRC